jgi:nucleotide-binding universal stress UspA family protein
MSNPPVLVTTDLSPESIHAFSFAREEALRRDAEVILLSVLEDWNVPVQTYDYTPPHVFYDLKEHLVAQRKKSLENIIQQNFTEIQSSVRVSDLAGSSVAEEIVSVAKEVGAGVIVIASHGKGALSSFLLGSVVERVVRLAQSPILVIPPKLADTE